MFLIYRLIVTRDIRIFAIVLVAAILMTKKLLSLISQWTHGRLLNIIAIIKRYGVSPMIFSIGTFVVVQGLHILYQELKYSSV